MAGRIALLRRRLSGWLWQRKLRAIARRLEQRQQALSRLTQPRPPFWPGTAPGKGSVPRNTASLAPGRRRFNACGRGRVERLALLLDRLSLGLALGTRLVWRPWHRLRHRLTAWLLSLLIPVLFDVLLRTFSRRRTWSPVVTCATKRARQAPTIVRWLVLSLRLLCRQLAKS